MRVRQVPLRSFPSGDRRPVAVLALEPEELTDRYGLIFEEGTDDLDCLRFAAIELPNHEQLLLLRYLRARTPGTEVMADAHANPVASRMKLLRELGLTEAELTWWPETS